MAPRESAAGIATHLGRTLDGVKHAAKRYGIRLRKFGENCPNARYSDELIEQARRLHETGVGPRAIAKQLGINEWTLRAALYYRQRRVPASHQQVNH